MRVLSNGAVCRLSNSSVDHRFTLGGGIRRRGRRLEGVGMELHGCNRAIARIAGRQRALTTQIGIRSNVNSLVLGAGETVLRRRYSGSTLVHR